MTTGIPISYLYCITSKSTLDWGRQIRILGLILLLSMTACSNLFLFPDRIIRLTPDALGLEYEDRFYKMPDGIKLHAWLLKSAKENADLILFFHGNAQNISSHIASVHWLPEHGFDVLLLDYRGYGKSEGTADLRKIVSDLEVFIPEVLTSAEFKNRRILVFGQSLGATLAGYMFATLPEQTAVAKVVLESPFASYRLIAREKLAELWLTWPVQYPLSFLVTDRFSPQDVIAKLSPVPLLLVHGDADVVVPSHHSEILFGAAEEPKEIWRIEGVGHLEIFLEETLRGRLLEYLRRP